ncbi:MAG: Ada metal-binding domain-containing protein [Taibaiella sp.]|jgi:methylphosphotriester-DNA--protein-cysteine methyltransferase
MMIAHTDLGSLQFTRSRKLLELIREGTITFAGNKRLKIYGTLQCVSGKKMKVENRVFFSGKNETKALGYRPCGHCMKADYLQWKTEKNEHII